MLYIEDAGLDPSTVRGLKRYQSEVDSAGTYPQRVTKGKELFSARNRESNSVFRAVRARLREMCAGAQRRGYCEDSVGDEVEHIMPKDLYPERVFLWQNYLLACGRCNVGKSNKFAVIVGWQLMDVTRRHGAPIRTPRRGDPGLINPRAENPLVYLDLELETFMFLPREDLTVIDERRAQYTIEVLKLNRDVLLEARREAYGAYRARLLEYRDLRNADAQDAKLSLLTDAVMSSSHPTVWREMQRQRTDIEELKDLFSAVPGAAHW